MGITVYSYMYDTYEYCGTTTADESPLEPGVYHIPACATEVEPPPFVEGKSRHFVDGVWTYYDIIEPVDPELETESILPEEV
jgi:hypothetical protein